MTLTRLFTTDVRILTAGQSEPDRYGRRVPDWSRAIRVTTQGWLEQIIGSENTSDRNAQIGSWRLILPAGTQITGSNRVETDDATFEVIGPPNRLRTPRGEHHVETILKVVTG